MFVNSSTGIFYQGTVILKRKAIVEHYKKKYFKYDLIALLVIIVNMINNDDRWWTYMFEILYFFKVFSIDG